MNFTPVVLQSIEKRYCVLLGGEGGDAGCACGG